MNDYSQDKKSLMCEHFKDALNFDAIRKRIEIDKDQYAKRGKDWAEYIGILPTAISNFHRRKNPRNPSFEYILAVAYKTKKPIEWYLYGTTEEDEKPSDIKQTDVVIQEESKPWGTKWTDEDIIYCTQLKRIFDSKHPVIVPMIISNLAAFEHIVNEEEKKDRKVKNLEKRIESLEKLNKNDCKKNDFSQTGAHTIDDELDKVMEQ